jgi:hypothetical protein
MYRIDKILFQHEQQLDPTDIVLVPYDVERLRWYSIQIGLALVVLSPRQHVLKLHWVMLSTIIMLVIFVLCGASPYQHISHTILASLHSSFLIWLDPPIFSYNTNVTATKTMSFWSWHAFSEAVQHRIYGVELDNGNKKVLAELSIQQHRQKVLQSVICHCIVACLIPVSILRLYDRGWQVQRWPVPIVLGTTSGWTMGLIFGTQWIIHSEKLVAK